MTTLLQTVQAWFARNAGVDEQRWVVLDVESSGLDAKRDRLLAFAALGVHFDRGAPRIHIGDSFEVVLRQGDAPAAPDKANILLHGIGVAAQRAGCEPALALSAFDAWLDASPLLGFHAPFDRALITRAYRTTLGRELRNPWLDLDPLARVLHPRVPARALDEWLAHFDIDCAQRHQAAADALATAELLQKLWPALRRELPQQQPRFRDVQALAASQRWLPG
jgi:DNA polymerase III subunit epsilon